MAGRCGRAATDPSPLDLPRELATADSRRCRCTTGVGHDLAISAGAYGGEGRRGLIVQPHLAYGPIQVARPRRANRRHVGAGVVPRGWAAVSSAAAEFPLEGV